MLKAKTPSGGGTVRYVPKAFGNDKDQDPVSVWLKKPTAGDQRELGEVLFSGRKRKHVPMAALHHAVRRMVVSVENYVDADGKLIADGHDLASKGDSQIVDEIAAEIIKLTFGGPETEKKHEPPPG